MELLILTACLLALGGLLTMSCLGTVALWRCLRLENPRQTEAPAETPEEKEARRLAQEAQRRYEEGFVNLMNYDGSPAGRKEASL